MTENNSILISYWGYVHIDILLGLNFLNLEIILIYDRFNHPEQHYYIIVTLQIMYY